MTDHRAEAETWLEAAQDGYFLTEPDQRKDGWATTAAFLAIAHDLHRIADALEQSPDDQPGPGNTEADYTDDGQLIGPARHRHDWIAVTEAIGTPGVRRFACDCGARREIAGDMVTTTRPSSVPDNGACT